MICSRFADEKIVEDMNGFIRDMARARRNKTVPMSTVHDRTIRSGVLSSRGFKGPEIALAEIASVKNIKKVTTESNEKLYMPSIPEDMQDSDIDRILLPRRDWMSPTVPASFQRFQVFVIRDSRAGCTIWLCILVWACGCVCACWFFVRERNAFRIIKCQQTSKSPHTRQTRASATVR